MNCKECTKFKTCEKARNPENYAFPSCKDFKAEQEQEKKMRERMIELLSGKSIDTQSDIEYVADFLLQNGVTIAPCKIGDKVYQVDNGGRIYTSTINNVMYCTGTIAFDERAIGKNVFLSEEALKGGAE